MLGFSTAVPEGGAFINSVYECMKHSESKERKQEPVLFVEKLSLRPYTQKLQKTVLSYFGAYYDKDVGGMKRNYNWLAYSLLYFALI